MWTSTEETQQMRLNEGLQSREYVICEYYSARERVECNGTIYEIPEQAFTYRDELFWLYIFLYIFLMLMSGVFSGLVLGLVSLDQTILKVLKDAGPPKIKRYATRIAPIVEHHHLLLVTLLLANAICMEAMPLCLDRLSDPMTAMFVSVTTVLFFGEVIPQAVCSRYGLAIGATLAPFVYFLIAIFLPVAWPISKLLDVILGKGHGTYYRRAELKALVNLHGKSPHEHPRDHHHDILTRDEIMIIQSALDMKDKTAADIMVPIDKVFMLNMDACLDDETLLKIQKSYFSRIPVFEDNRQNIQGILMVKCLIRLNPCDAKPMRALVKTKALSRPHYIQEDASVFDVLNHFHDSKTHVSVVIKSYDIDECEVNETLAEGCDFSRTRVLGIITLEGIIEQLIQKDLFKESELFQSSLNSVLHMALAKLSSRQTSSPPTPHYMHQSLREETELLSPTLTQSYQDSLGGNSLL